MARLTPQQIAARLSEPHVAHLATVRPDGRPHLAPVWFEVAGNLARIMTDADSVKARNLAENPSATLSIASPSRPYWYIILEGTTTLTREGLVRSVERICVKYDGPVKGKEFAGELLEDDDMVLIEMAIQRTISWQDDD